MLFNEKSARNAFKVNQIIDSGGRRAKLRILDMDDKGIRIQSIGSQSNKFFTYEYIQIVIDGFDQIIPDSVHESIQLVLTAAGEKKNFWTENYAYGIAREFRENCSSALFLYEGETEYLEPEDQQLAMHEEGARIKVLVERIERDPKARLACITHYGAVCQACTFDFGVVYGSIGKGFIHVHHRSKLASSLGKHAVNPIDDLVPLCANCHAMAHTREKPLSVEELRQAIEAAAL